MQLGKNENSVGVVVEKRMLKNDDKVDLKLVHIKSTPEFICYPDNI